jgi:hypothetical protein
VKVPKQSILHYKRGDFRGPGAIKLYRMPSPPRTLDRVEEASGEYGSIVVKHTELLLVMDMATAALNRWKEYCEKTHRCVWTGNRFEEESKYAG